MIIIGTKNSLLILTVTLATMIFRTAVTTLVAVIVLKYTGVLH